MNVVILGSGGREHAFAWKIASSPLLTNLFVAPGNPGTAEIATNLELDLTNFTQIRSVLLQQKIDMVIIGPEVPLVKGLVDYLHEHLPEIYVIGPKKSGAALEGSKGFAKEFMQRHGIPTARYREFDHNLIEEGLNYLSSHPLPIVLKADGLAAGKGVLILHDREEAKREFVLMLQGKFGAASKRVVVEEFLKGREFSVFALTDGKDFVILPMAKDYKRIGEGDTGLNTGGMGSLSPVPFVDRALYETVVDQVIKPTILGLQKDDLSYQGFIFFGLIEVNGDPFVIEYNCRMGDPETQSVLPRINSDLLEVFDEMRKGNLAGVQLDVDAQCMASVILVSGGYPETYEKGKSIEGLGSDNSSLIFQAGTKESDHGIVTNGGRVLALTSAGKTLAEALEKSYTTAETIQFEGKYMRRDIGFDVDLAE